MKVLDAVNYILPKLGEHTVTSVDARHPTVALITGLIDHHIRLLLGTGWWFNQFDYTGMPDIQGEIAISGDVLEFLPTDDSMAVLRDGKLYNPSTRTYVWDRAVPGIVKEFVGFESLPESAALLVMYNSLVDCYTTDLGSDQVLQVWMSWQNKADSDFLAEHLRHMKYSTRRTRQAQQLRNALRTT